MREAAIAGAGYGEVGRELDTPAAALAVQAALAALADAGLSPADVDGMACYPGSPVSCFNVAETIGVPRIDWFADIFGWAPAAISPVIVAAQAVQAGACEIALAFYTVKRNRERPPGAGFGTRVGGDLQFRAPYGDPMTTQWLARWAQRHMHVYGTTEEHLGNIAVTFRRHASMNPRAALRDPITLDDYFASPYVSTPFRLLDCDYPVDGAGAVVVTTAERARDLPHRPVRVLSSAIATGPRPDWDQWEDLTYMASRYAAERLWARTDLRPADLDVAEVYDGFSWLALCWLEDLGLCAKGEGGPFVAAGNVALGGRVPTNTHGGSLSGGRLHAISHVIEGVQQLRGECGDRQVSGAEVGVVTAGGGIMAGALLLAAG